MNRKGLRAADYAEHMLEFIARIEDYLKGKDLEDFRDDPKTRDAVLRNMEILGEAANNLRTVFPDAEILFPKIPFTQIYGMRNHLAHGYFVIDVDILWKVIERDLKNLRPHIEALVLYLKDISESQSNS
jgi:uncharacterized protein with HEPN domain